MASLSAAGMFAYPSEYWHTRPSARERSFVIRGRNKSDTTIPRPSDDLTCQFARDTIINWVELTRRSVFYSSRRDAKIIYSGRFARRFEGDSEIASAEKCKISYRRENVARLDGNSLPTRRYFRRGAARARTLCTYASGRNGGPIADPDDGLKFEQTVFGDWLKFRFFFLFSFQTFRAAFRAFEREKEKESFGRPRERNERRVKVRWVKTAELTLSVSDHRLRCRMRIPIAACMQGMLLTASNFRGWHSTITPA